MWQIPPSQPNDCLYHFHLEDGTETQKQTPIDRSRFFPRAVEDFKPLTHPLLGHTTTPSLRNASSPHTDTLPFPPVVTVHTCTPSSTHTDHLTPCRHTHAHTHLLLQLTLDYGCCTAFALYSIPFWFWHLRLPIEYSTLDRSTAVTRWQQFMQWFVQTKNYK